MTYVIRNSDGTIKTFAERGDDVSLQNGETVEQVGLSFDEYANRLKLSVNGKSGSTIKAAVGSEDITVTVSCPGESSVELAVNDLTETVTLTKGTGLLTLSAGIAGIFLISPSNKGKYCAAGEAVLVVEVVE
jgi:hypothetical protein